MDSEKTPRSSVSAGVEAALEHLQAFQHAHASEYRGAMVEYRPEQGYGRSFSRAHDVYQGLLDVLSLVTEREQLDPRIPEGFASPAVFRRYCDRAAQMCRTNLIVATEIADEFDSPMSVPEPVSALAHFSHEMSAALQYALELSSEDTFAASGPTPPHMNQLERLCERFHTVASPLANRRDGKTTWLIEDEYDVQDLFHGLLRLFFDDVRPEEYTPSYAGRHSRTDFLLKKEQIMVEVKKTRSGLRDKQVGEQLTLDRAYYSSHSDCQSLVCFVYDPDGHIANPCGLTRDLEATDGLPWRIFIRPNR